VNIIVTTPPAEPAVSVAEAKTMLRVDHSVDDTLISQLIYSAIDDVQNVGARALVTQTLTLALDGWPKDNVIRLWHPPVQSVISVRYYDESNVLQTMDSSDYVAITDVTPGLIVLASNASWPCNSMRAHSPVRVQYVAGYGAAASVPHDWKMDIMALVAIAYENREALSSQAAAQRQNVLARIKSRWGWAG